MFDYVTTMEIQEAVAALTAGACHPIGDLSTIENLSKPPARFECKAHGAAAPAHPAIAPCIALPPASMPSREAGCRERPSTAQRGNRAAQEVSRGSLQLFAARLYQGQTTNFRTPGGGFAPVYQAPDVRSDAGSDLSPGSICVGIGGMHATSNDATDRISN